VSKRILSCPPINCMPFNCPGHEMFRKGLSGCGIHTVNAPVGTVFVLTFIVSDLSFPSATSEVVRRIIVVSPCGRGQTYCSALAQPAPANSEFACGTSDCISRAAILSLQPAQPLLVPLSIEFSKALPLCAISNRSVGLSMLSGSLLGGRAATHSLVCCTYLNTVCIVFTSLLLVNKINACLDTGLMCIRHERMHLFAKHVSENVESVLPEARLQQSMPIKILGSCTSFMKGCTCLLSTSQKMWRAFFPRTVSLAKAFVPSTD
jgi:hypothetical protein